MCDLTLSCVALLGITALCILCNPGLEFTPRFNGIVWDLGGLVIVRYNAAIV